VLLARKFTVEVPLWVTRGRVALSWAPIARLYNWTHTNLARYPHLPARL